MAIVGGATALGVGGFMLFKGNSNPKKETNVEPPQTQNPAVEGNLYSQTNTNGLAETSSSPSTTGGGQLSQTQQIGPYTLLQDPTSGMQLVFETQTQQFQGIMDEQGNLVPATLNANGEIQLTQQASSAEALGQQVTSAPSDHSSISDAQRGAVYEQIAYELFSNAAATMSLSANSAATGTNLLDTQQLDGPTASAATASAATASTATASAASLSRSMSPVGAPTGATASMASN